MPERGDGSGSGLGLRGITASLTSFVRGDPDRRDPRLAAVLDGALAFALPLSRRFRGTTLREGMLLRGPSGWGEFAPFPDYDDASAARWLAAGIEAAWGDWPVPVRSTVPVNAIIPAVGPEDAAALTTSAVRDAGCSTVKVKVAEPGQSLGADDDRVGAVRAVLDDLLGPGQGLIRVDANGAWSVAEAVQALRELSRHDLEYAEQPCRTAEELREVRLQVSVPIAADELVRLAADPGSVRLAEIADVAVLKVPPLGGVWQALAVARTVGVPVVVSSALDSAVGLSAGIALAAALPELPYACGLGTGALLAADVVTTPLVPRAGVLPAGRVDPDTDAALAGRSRLSDSRARWWRHRLAAAWRAGAAEHVGHLVRP